MFHDKPLVLLATSPGARGAASVLAAATHSMPFFAGDVKATQSIPSFFDNFDLELNTLKNEDLKQQLIQAVASLKELPAG